MFWGAGGVVVSAPAYPAARRGRAEATPRDGGGAVSALVLAGALVELEAEQGVLDDLA